MQKIPWPLYLLLGFSLLFSASGYGQQDDTVHFVEESNWPPFTPNHFGLTQQGLSYAIIEEIFSRLNRPFDLELLPQLRMLKYLQEGQRDAATVISKNSDRLKFLIYSDEIFQKKGRIYYSAKRKKAFSWQNYEDLVGLNIGTVMGHNYGADFINANKEYRFKLKEVIKVEQNFGKLLTGRIDVFLCNELTAKQFLRNPKYKDKIIASNKNYFEKGYHIAFSKFSTQQYLLPKINKTIRAMKKDGSLKEIINRYTD